MKKSYILTLAVLLSFTSYAQLAVNASGPSDSERSEAVITKKSSVDTKVEKRFIQELSTKMMKHLRLPDMVNEYNIQGKVLASVHVDAEGNVNNVEIIDGLGKSIDRSVTKAFLKVKNIEPIIVNGKASETTVILPILIRS